MSCRNNKYPRSTVYHFPNPVHCLANHSKLSGVIGPQLCILLCTGCFIFMSCWLDHYFNWKSHWEAMHNNAVLPCCWGLVEAFLYTLALTSSQWSPGAHAKRQAIFGLLRSSLTHIISKPERCQSRSGQKALDRKGGKRLVPHDEKNDRIIFGHL